MTTTYYSYIDGPLGRMVVQGDGHFVTGLYMPQHKGWRGREASWQQSDAPFTLVRAQLAEYFAGARQQFDVPIKLTGTAFQQRVWQELLRIPFAMTITYAQLAERIGNPTASRAVGHANGRNPISIIVPCHRVVGVAGQLTGYAGGVDKKRWLLDWESNHSPDCGVDYAHAGIRPLQLLRLQRRSSCSNWRTTLVCSVKRSRYPHVGSARSFSIKVTSCE